MIDLIVYCVVNGVEMLQLSLVPFDGHVNNPIVIKHVYYSVVFLSRMITYFCYTIIYDCVLSWLY